MKKIIILLTFLITTLAAHAQQVTEKDLQGTWKLVSYKDTQVAIDAIKGTFVLDAQFKEDLTPDEVKEEEHNYTIMARQYKVAKITFKGNAQNRLISELQKILILTNTMGWTLQYKGQNIDNQSINKLNPALQ